MTAAALDDPFRPRPPEGLGRGAALALLAHALLLAALTLGVQWRASTPEVVSAELWSAVPQRAAPREQAPPPPEPEAQAPTPAPPPPPPRAQPAPEPEPDIALEKRRQQLERERREAQERQRQERQEKERLEKERQQRLRAEQERRERAEQERRAQREKQRREQQEQERREARERQAAEARLAKQREENLRRIQAQAGSATGTGAPGSTGTAARDSGPSASYTGRLIAQIKPNIVFTEQLAGNPAAEVEVRTGPAGTIIARRLLRSSGSREWDEAVLRAIDRTGTLPRDIDGRVPPVLQITFRPND